VRLRWGAGRAPVSTGAAAPLARRAAALMRAGVPAARVWKALAEDGASGGAAQDDALQRVVSCMSSGATAAEALASGEAPEWRALSAVWWTAESSGAPLADVLDRFAASMRAIGQVAERRAVLLAGPRATIRLVVSLPPVAMALGALLGFNPLQALGGPTGWAIVALGVLLLALGVCWSVALLRRVERADWVAGWEFELVAVAIAGGGSRRMALRLAADCSDRARAEWVRLEALAPGGAVESAVAAADSHGAPLGPLLLGEAERCRDRAQAELEQAAERLGVSVLVPLGVCVLPAFVLLGVVPVLLSVLGGAGGSWGSG